MGEINVEMGNNGEAKEETKRYKCCNVLRTRGPGGWCKKFFWEGQIHTKGHDENAALEKLSSDLPWYRRALIKHRRAIGFILPGSIVHMFWWAFMIKYNFWYLFTTNYPMSFTMIFGSLVAGMTSEGGGAVAFPVMTLALNLSPGVARDFSLMVQAFGMSCASFSIFFMKVRVEWFAIIFCSLGSWLGMVIGFHVIDPRMQNAQKKMFFVSIWFAFAFCLFLLNRMHKRRTFLSIPQMTWWKALVLYVAGIVGGIFTSFAGSGLDICSFSVLTLLFRVSEKVATPTSVILMAFGSQFAFYWREVMMDGIYTLSWEYIAVCAPVVVIGAPCGALLGTHFHRQVLASFIYVIDTVSLVAAFILVPQTPLLAGISVGIIAVGFGFFGLLTYIGEKILFKVEDNEEKEKIEKVESNEESITDSQNHNALTNGHISNQPIENGITPTANGNVNHKKHAQNGFHNPAMVVDEPSNATQL